MREHATLRLTDGRKPPVEVESKDLDQKKLVVHRAEVTEDIPGSNPHAR